MIGQRLVSIILEAFSNFIYSVLTDVLKGTGLSLSALFCVSSECDVKGFPQDVFYYKNVLCA